MEYVISKGDTMWSIVKNHYNYSSSEDIWNIIEQLSDSNNLENPNLIYAGAKLNLVENDMFVSQDAAKETNNAQPATQEQEPKTIADEFDEWTASSENLTKSIMGEEVEEFKMFDIDLSKYSKDLKNFAQQYIDKFDANKNGEWELNEFMTMMTGDAVNTAFMEDSQVQDLGKQLFNDLNLDGQKKGQTVSSEEFASYLYLSDLNLEGFLESGQVAPNIDGKINYENYHMLSDPALSDTVKNFTQTEMQDFYNHYYATK